MYMKIRLKVATETTPVARTAYLANIGFGGERSHICGRFTGRAFRYSGRISYGNNPPRGRATRPSRRDWSAGSVVHLFAEPPGRAPARVPSVFYRDSSGRCGCRLRRLVCRREDFGGTFWGHAQRKLFELHKAQASPIAAKTLKRIAALSVIEAEVCGQLQDHRRKFATRKPDRCSMT